MDEVKCTETARCLKLEGHGGGHLFQSPLPAIIERESDIRRMDFLLSHCYIHSPLTVMKTPLNMPKEVKSREDIDRFMEYFVEQERKVVAWSKKGVEPRGDPVVREIVKKMYDDLKND